MIDALNKEFEIKEQIEEQIDEEVKEREEEEEVEEEKREETGLKEEDGDGNNRIEKDREGRNESEKDVGGRDEGVFVSMFLMPDIKNVVLIPQVIILTMRSFISKIFSLFSKFFLDFKKNTVKREILSINTKKYF